VVVAVATIGWRASASKYDGRVYLDAAVSSVRGAATDRR
jgi:hypothetical protein